MEGKKKRSKSVLNGKLINVHLILRLIEVEGRKRDEIKKKAEK